MVSKVTWNGLMRFPVVCRCVYVGLYTTTISFMWANHTTLGPLFSCSSGPNDRVFVYFADHGAPGIVAFPEKMVSQSLSPTLSCRWGHLV